MPTAVNPVPPLAVGRAVPEYVIASVPVEVIGDPVVERKVGTVCDTEETDPNPAEDHEVDPIPSVVSTCPAAPISGGNFITYVPVVGGARVTAAKVFLSVVE